MHFKSGEAKTCNLAFWRIIPMKTETVLVKCCILSYPEEASLLCSFYHESLRTWIKTIVNKFATSSHTALISGMHAFRSFLKLICEYELDSLPNKNVSGAKDHGKNYIKVGLPLVRHLLRNRPLSS